MRDIHGLRFLLLIHDEGMASREEVMTHLEVDTAHMSKICKSLTSQGLIETAYRLTDKGKQNAELVRKALGSRDG